MEKLENWLDDVWDDFDAGQWNTKGKKKKKSKRGKQILGQESLSLPIIIENLSHLYQSALGVYYSTQTLDMISRQP